MEDVDTIFIQFLCNISYILDIYKFTISPSKYTRKDRKEVEERSSSPDILYFGTIIEISCKDD